MEKTQAPVGMNLAAPVQIDAFEARLITLARLPFPVAASQQFRKYLQTPSFLHRRFTSDTSKLLKDTLRKGCASSLARLGGWKNEKAWNESLPPGPVWKRNERQSLSLHFSSRLPEILVQFTALGIGQFESQKAITSKELSPGDLLYFFLFYRQARPEKEVMAVLLRLPLFQQNPLVQLAYPTDFQEYPEDIISDWEPWMRGQYAMILDALQGYLSEEWLKAEKAKSSIHSWENMKRLGSVYEKLFDGYLKAVESSGRWDLARFLLRMLNSLFQYQSLSLEFWIEQLRDQDVPTKLSDRLLVHRQAIVVPRVLERMRQWTERARAVAFFEEDYSKAQWWLREWEEHNGPRLVEYVRRLTQEAEPLRLGSGATREKPA